ncbi:MAG: HisA/HisF-related TIM barrel protein [Promethearchaeota archaeon]
MSNFKIIPVIDILNSEAVHAIKGDRIKYKPLKSKLINSSNPVKIINILDQKFNFKEFYIADLDAIINKNPNLDLLLKILKISNIKIMIDPGISNKADIKIYSKFKINKLILGLETIKKYSVITKALKILSENKIIVSVDMYNGKIISNLKKMKPQDPLKVINTLKKLGIKELILLDLFRVGQKMGGIPPLYLKIREIFDGDILVGGGIKDLTDITLYKEKMFSGILIATALYDGTLNLKKLINNH